MGPDPHLNFGQPSSVEPAPGDSPVDRLLDTLATATPEQLRRLKSVLGITVISGCRP